jgi:hypothetical protein
MRVTATVTRDGSRYYAQCREVDRAGEGATLDEAVASLKEALREYFGEVPAVAPPPEPRHDEIEIVVVEVPAKIQR